ncbi:FG-GAP-like repeat-containing protein [Chitinibacteraceae bacterium HSL-7]
MVSLVSGNATGLLNSQLSPQLGAGLGGGAIGRNGETSAVNVANGNLILQRRDQVLRAIGSDATLLRTYNSQAKFTDDNADGWWINGYRRLVNLTGTLNTVGSSLQRVGTDGALQTYRYDAALNTYRSTDGDGAYDTLHYSAGAQQWSWTDGSSGVQETYGSYGDYWRLLSSRDPSGITQTYSYTGALLSRVQMANGDSIEFTYSGNNLTQERVKRADGSYLGQTYYYYDAQNRLGVVKVDLTPDDNSIADGKVYTTTYTYDGTSNRLASISQTDGSKLSFTYDTVGGEYRVATVTDALSRVTRFAYDLTNRSTTVTDALGYITTYLYDTEGRLLSVTGPASGSLAQKVSYQYDANGNLIASTDAQGNSIRYTYDANGNVISQQDGAGNRIERTYSSSSLLLAETVYRVPDPDGIGSGAASQPETVRYVYDAQSNLRFTVSAEGRVTEYRYDAQGLRSSGLNYLGGTYSLTGLALTQAPSLAQLASWVTAQDAGQTTREEYGYDSRGQLIALTRYARVDDAGAGVPASASVTRYSYDVRGNLLSQVDANQSGATTPKQTSYVYDGLGRLLSTVDTLGQSTLHQYDDANRKIVHTQANGRLDTETYDTTGQLLSLVQGGLAPTQYRYDANGQLRLTIDGSGAKTYMLYDARGNLVAEIDRDGIATEYVYNPAGQRIQTVRYSTALSGATRNTLADASNNPLNVDFSTIRPASTATDQVSWQLYDAAGRLSKVVDALGYVTETRYDGVGRIERVIQYATAISTATLGAMTQASSVNPPANATADRITRNFYDKDGKQTGQLDAEGYLTQYDYDAAGRKTHAVRYATVTAQVNRANGALTSLIPTLTRADQHTWLLYDGQNRLVGTVDPEGYLTETQYDAVGNVLKSIRYATPVWEDGGISQFGDAQRWVASYGVTSGGWTSQERYPRVMADVNGDGKDDLIAFGAAAVQVRLSSGNGFSGYFSLADFGWNHGWTSQDAMPRTAVDVNGDGRADLVGINADGVYVALSTGTGFSAKQLWYSGLNAAENWLQQNDTPRLFGDVNGDGKADLIGLGQDRVMVALSTGSGFASAVEWGSEFTKGSGWTSQNAMPRQLADVDGDGKQDLVGFGADGVYVALSTGSGFGGATKWIAGYAVDTSWSTQDKFPRMLADINGDGKADLIGFAANSTVMALSTGSKFSGAIRVYDFNYDSGWTSQNTLPRTVGDVNGDGKADLIGFGADGMWVARAKTLSLDALRPIVSGADQVTRFTYTVRHQVATQTAADGTVTRSSYDALGNVTATERADGSSEERQDLARYNQNGQLIATLSGEGAARLVTGQTQAQVDAIWAQYGTQYAYDALGRKVRVSVRNPDGSTNSTLYYYTAEGQLRYQVNGLGEVTAYSYTAQGQVSQTRQYVARVAAGTLASWSGGSPTVAVEGAITALAGALDRVSQVQYNGRGEVVRTIDALGYTVESQYNAFGNLSLRLAQVGAGQVLKQQFEYDARGFEVVRYDDVGGALNRERKVSYDAFGRPLSQIDATGVVSSQVYDRLGRVVQTTDATGAQRSSSYDAFGRIATSTDALGNVTRYAYDVTNRSVSVTTPDGVVSTTVQNSHGETVTVTDGLGNSVLYDYDKDGQLSKTTDALGQTTGRAYDQLGRLFQLTDANGVITQYEYDAAGRQLKRIVDVNGLKLQTAWSYDGTGNRLTEAQGTVSSPAQRSVTYQYDAKGQLLSQTVANGSNPLKTSYTYDASGKTLTVIEGDGSTTPRKTEYQYDVLGRRIAEIQDPAGLKLITRYEYDGNDNMVVKTDAAGNVTRYAYDPENRLRFTLDAMGYIAESRYDAEGRVLQSLRYVGSIGIAGNPSAEQLEAAVNGLGNQLARQVYSKDGRLLFSIDAAGYVTESSYDAAGRVIQSTRYANAISLSGNPSETQVRSALRPIAADQQLWQIYDAVGRLRFSVNDAGYVKENVYDVLGQVHTSIDYSTPVASNAMANEAEMVAALVGQQSDVNRRTTSYSYDNLGRVLTQTDALNQTQSWTYDALGNKASWTNVGKSTWTYAYDALGRLLLETSPSVSSSKLTEAAAGSGVFSVVNTSVNFKTRYTYDALGNVLTKTEADGLPEARTTEYRYDALGRQIQTIHPQVEVWNSSGSLVGVSKPVERAVYDALGRVVIKVDVAGKASQVVFDQAGRVAFEIDSLGYVTSYTYDAFGNRLRTTRHDVATTVPSDSIPQTMVALVSAYGAGGNKLSSENDRSIIYGYDQLNRVVSQNNPTSGMFNPSGGLAFLGYKRILQNYDAFGHVILRQEQEINASNGIAISSRNHYFYFNGVGQQTASIDAGGYLTEMQYDAAGNVSRRIEYANAAGNVSTSGYTKGGGALAVAGAATSAGFDREVTYTYDKLGRKATETQYRVQSHTPNGNSVVARIDNLTTSYRYDALGNLVNVRDGFGNESFSWYDALGRTSAVLDIARVVDGGASVRPLTVFKRDVYGNVVQQTRHANAGAVNADGTVWIPPAAGSDQTEYTQYDVHGRASRQVNAMGNSQYTRYDLAGRSAYEWVTAKGQSETQIRQQVRGYDYDALGRQTTTKQLVYTPDLVNESANGTSTASYITSVGYNAFGEITAKGDSTSGVAAEVFHYNRAGQLIADNKNGVAHGYRYNAFGDLTLQLESNSRNLLDASYLNYRHQVGFDMTGVVASRIGYDELGRATQTWQGARSLNGGAVANTSYNRWGDKTTETGYDGATFGFTYSGGQLARVIYQGNGKAATDISNVFYTAVASGEQWSVSSATLVGKVLNEYYYDGAGRKTGEKDANGNLVTYSYDAAGNLTKEDRSIGLNDISYTYDLFGRRVSESGNTGYANATRFSYDQLNRRTQAVIGGRTIGYAYNALNQLVTQTTSYAGAAALVERYSYNENGQVTVLDSNANNFIQHYSYDNRGNKTLDRKVGRAGGQLSMGSTYDYYGRLRSRTDLGNNTIYYNYDLRGRMVEEFSRMHLSTDTAGTGAIDSENTHWLFYDYDDQNRLIAQVDYSRLNLDDRAATNPWGIMDGYTRIGTTTATVPVPSSDTETGGTGGTGGSIPVVDTETGGTGGSAPVVDTETGGTVGPAPGSPVDVSRYNTSQWVGAGAMPDWVADNGATLNVNEYNQFVQGLASYFNNPAAWSGYFGQRAPEILKGVTGTGTYTYVETVTTTHTGTRKVEVPEVRTEATVTEVPRIATESSTSTVPVYGTSLVPIYDSEGQVTGHRPVTVQTGTKDVVTVTNYQVIDKVTTYTEYTVYVPKDESYTYETSEDVTRTGTQDVVVDAVRTYSAPPVQARRMAVTTYAYDNAGRRISERAVINGTTEHQIDHIQYDALGRVLSSIDTGAAGYALNYAYDAKGNRIQVKSTFNDINGTSKTLDNWYVYDAHDRMVLTQGVNNGGVLGINTSQGTILGYDGLGNRRAETSYRSELVSNYIVPTLEQETATQATPYYSLSVGNVKTVTYYDYDGDGQVTRGYSNLLNGRLNQNSTTAFDTVQAERLKVSYDAYGRVTQQVTRDDWGKHVAGFSQESTTNNTAYIGLSGLVDTTNTVTTRREGELTNYTTKTETQGSDYAYDAFGNTTGYSFSVRGSNSVDGTTSYAYAYLDGLKVRQVTNSRTDAQGNGTMTVSFDGNGNIRSNSDTRDANNNRWYTTDAAGHIYRKGGGDSKVERNFYVLDQQVGDNQAGITKGVKYSGAPTVAGEGTTTQYSQASVGNFDLTYTPIASLGRLAQGNAASSYTVNTGDTLRGIAQSLLGDASLWWLIADANGLANDQELQARVGQSLTVPNRVSNYYNSTSTFRPYSAERIVGDLSPKLPDPPPPPKSQCQQIGQVVMIVVAVVVTIYTAGAASGAISTAMGATAGTTTATGAVVGGAVGAAAGSVASQMVGMAFGLQDSINWKAVAASALVGGITGGLGLNPNVGVSEFGKSLFSTNMAGEIAKGIARSAVTQGVNVSLGLQSKFSWQAVAAGGLSAGAGEWLGQQFGGLFKGSEIGQDLFDVGRYTISGAIGAWGGGNAAQTCGDPVWPVASPAQGPMQLAITLKAMARRIVLGRRAAGSISQPMLPWGAPPRQWGNKMLRQVQLGER